MSHPQNLPVDTPKRPTMAGVVIGIILIVLSFPVGLVIIISTLTSTPKELSSAEQFVADGSSNQISITGTRQMAIWVDRYSSVTEDCQMADPSGNDVALSYNHSYQYVDGWYMSDVFTPKVSGTYTVTCSSFFSYDVYYLVAPTTLRNYNAVGTLGGIAAGFVMFAGGLALIIVTAVRRGKWTNTYGAPPPGMATAYGQTAPWYPPQMPYQPPQMPYQPPQMPYQPPQMPYQPPQMPYQPPSAPFTGQ